MSVKAAITAAENWFTGEDRALRFTVKDDAGVAVDITGWALSWRFKRRVDDPDGAALITKTTGSGIALTTPASGICTVTIDDTDTDRLGRVDGVHELKRTDAGSEVVLAYGPALLQQGVHRS